MPWKKTYDKILEEPPPTEMPFDEVRGVLEHFGYAAKESGSSHVVFRKKGCYPIALPRKGGHMVKRCYLEEVASALRKDMVNPDRRKNE